MLFVSYNVHGWRTIDDKPNVALIATVLARVNADVIALNEVYHPAPTNDGMAMDCLAHQLGMSFAFGACEVRTLPDTSSIGCYGNALLSRAPLHSTFSALFSHTSDKEQRGWLECEINAGGGSCLRVIVTHLDHTDESTRMRQLEELLGAPRDSATAADVILGDLNCVHPRDYDARPNALVQLADHPLAAHLANLPHGPQVTGRLEEAGYVDAFVHKGILGTGTFIPAAEPVRFDYVWLSPTQLPNLTDVGTIDEPAGRESSDHRPVFAKLKLNPPSR